MTAKRERTNPLDKPHLKRFNELLVELKKESPRGEVMVSATVLDEQLAECIKSRLIDDPDVAKLLDGFNAPFGSFATRIVGAFALGCISDRERRELDTIRRIRNEFAHGLPVNFDDPGIKDRCALLTYAASDYANVVVPARSRFGTAVVALVLNLANRPFYVAQRRLSYEAWAY